MIATTERKPAKCVDLKERFGNKYRIYHDPARESRQHHDSWLCVIRCRTGAEIFPYGGNTLVVEIEGHRRLRARLMSTPACKLYQRGDDFASFLFDVANFRAIAKIVKPFRRRFLNPEQRAASIERLRKAREAVESA